MNNIPEDRDQWTIRIQDYPNPKHVIFFADEIEVFDCASYTKIYAKIEDCPLELLAIVSTNTEWNITRNDQ